MKMRIVCLVWAFVPLVSPVLDRSAPKDDRYFVGKDPVSRAKRLAGGVSTGFDGGDDVKKNIFLESSSDAIADVGSGFYEYSSEITTNVKGNVSDKEENVAAYQEDSNKGVMAVNEESLYVDPEHSIANTSGVIPNSEETSEVDAEHLNKNISGSFPGSGTKNDTDFEVPTQTVSDSNTDVPEDHDNGLGVSEENTTVPFPALQEGNDTGTLPINTTGSIPSGDDGNNTDIDFPNTIVPGPLGGVDDAIGTDYEFPSTTFPGNPGSDVDYDIERVFPSGYYPVTNEENVFDAKIKCRATFIEVSIHPKNNFTGLVFPIGLAWNHLCFGKYINASGNFTFLVPLHGCGTHSHEVDTGIEYANTIVIQPHMALQTHTATNVKVRCRYLTHTQTLDSAIHVLSPEGFIDISNMAPLPELFMRVYLGNLQTRSVAREVTVGEQLTLVFGMSNYRMYTLKAKNCVMLSGDGKRVVLIDENGCPTDTNIMGPFSYAPDLRFIFVEFLAHKFHDTNSVFFQCQVTFCVDEERDCGIIPPKCNLPARYANTSGIVDVDDNLREAFHYENLRMREEVSSLKAYREYMYGVSQGLEPTGQTTPKGNFARSNRWQRSPRFHKHHKAHRVSPEVEASIRNLMGGDLNYNLKVGVTVNPKNGDDTFVIPLYRIEQDTNGTYEDWDTISDVDFGGRRRFGKHHHRARNMDGKRHLHNSTSVGHGLITKHKQGDEPNTTIITLQPPSDETEYTGWSFLSIDTIIILIALPLFFLGSIIIFKICQQVLRPQGNARRAREEGYSMQNLADMPVHIPRISRTRRSIRQWWNASGNEPEPEVALPGPPPRRFHNCPFEDWEI